MLHLSTFDLEKSLLHALYQKGTLRERLPILRIGSPLSYLEEPHLWVEVTKAQVVGLNRVHAEGEVGVSIPLLKGNEAMSVIETVRDVLKCPLPLLQGQQQIGEAYLTEKSLHRTLKKEANLTIITFDAFLRLEHIFKDI
ncbi:MAG: hypothetical protein LBQ26_00505 [Holosporales bacterium]|jgi:hypothetical protein|nr:hypothetical protein [Holosporales bacterium]